MLNSNNHKDFAENFEYVTSIIKKLQKSKPFNNLKKINFSLPELTTGGYSNLSNVNKTIVNNILVGGVSNILELYSINFTKLFDKLNKELRAKKYTFIDNEETKFKQLASKLDTLLMELNKLYIKNIITELNSNMGNTNTTLYTNIIDKTINNPITKNNKFSNYYNEYINDETNINKINEKFNIFFKLYKQFNNIVAQVKTQTKEEILTDQLVKKINSLS